MENRNIEPTEEELLTRRSYYIPDNYRPNKRQIKSFESRYWRWRYKLICYRRDNLASINQQINELTWRINRFVKHNEWMEHQVHQFKDLCDIYKVDISTPPDEYDLADQLQERYEKARDTNTEFQRTHKYPRYGDAHFSQYHALQRNFEERQNEYYDWIENGQYAYLPYEERYNKNVVRMPYKGANVYEVPDNHSLYAKTLMPNNMKINHPNNRIKDVNVVKPIEIYAPVSLPTLRQMDKYNTLYNDRSRELEAIHTIEGTPTNIFRHHQ